MRRTIRFSLMFTVFLVLCALPSVAYAHVHITPDKASPGETVTFTLSVPNESESAATTEVKVIIPAEAASSTLSGNEADGWKVSYGIGSSGTSESMHSVIWNQGRIPVGETHTFSFAIANIPDVDRMLFKVIQTYDNGEVASWIQEPVETGEPDYPAPVVSVGGKIKTAETSETSESTPVLHNNSLSQRSSSEQVPKQDKDSGVPFSIQWTIAIILFVLIVVGGCFYYAKKSR